METWKRIPGFNLYMASDRGRIKTFNWKGSGQERIMKPALDASGYLRTMLKGDDGRIRTIKVHRIIGVTFISNPENKPQINHKNCIRNDNRVINLEWVTKSENMKHCFVMGRKTMRGTNNPASTVTEEQVLEIRQIYPYGRKFRKKGEISKKDLAIRFGTSVNVIKFIIQGRTWKHLL